LVAQCYKPCKHGICTGPNLCTCFKGFKGKYCDADINECGLIPRLCSQRCMNTHGAYRCYCRYGYQMSPDGKTCSSKLTFLWLIVPIS
uniref:EGF-like domain-containing protein n=1 Tax=Callorhinchus milii TaxID=7868 RepID=A0A4W3HT97_CALMI